MEDIIARIEALLANTPQSEIEEFEVTRCLRDCRDEIIAARACAEMMLQGTGQRLAEGMAERVIDGKTIGLWIPVEERWPKHGSDVLVAYKAGQYVLFGVGEFDGTTVNDDGMTVPYFKGIGGFEVTHWMPLPEPPAQ